MLFLSFPLLGDIFHYAIGSFILGIVLTLAFVFLLFFLIKGFYPKNTFSPLSIGVGVVLTLLLIPQMVQLCGAVAIKMKTADVAEWLDENYVRSNEQIVPLEISEETSMELCDELVRQYPMVKYFVGGGIFTGYDTSNICQAIAYELNSFLNKFIWKSLGWSLLYVLIGSVLVIWTIHRGRKFQPRTSGRSQTDYRINRRSTQRHVGASAARRISRY